MSMGQIENYSSYKYLLIFGNLEDAILIIPSQKYRDLLTYYENYKSIIEGLKYILFLSASSFPLPFNQHPWSNNGSNSWVI